ncbi:MAG TPA: RluA family pseudouridine synthase [Polyangia bacterium]
MSTGPRTIAVGPEAAGQRLDVVLAKALTDVSRTQLARHIASACVLVNGQPAGAPSQKVRAGDVVFWNPPEVVSADIEAEALPLSIVFEDESLVVLEKPAGLVVHPAPGHEAGTLVNALLAHCKDLRGIGGELRPGIVHRLDRDTSGLMVVAKDDVAMNALGADFKVHRILRRYEALVIGQPPRDSGRIETLHGRDPFDRKKFSVKVKTGRKAITNWSLVEPLPGAARLEAVLETGRTHQVRVHFAAMGVPILGDRTYGRPPRDLAVRAIGETLGRQALHAKTLGFHHPRTKAWLQFEAPPPADMAAALAALRALDAGKPAVPGRAPSGKVSRGKA